MSENTIPEGRIAIEDATAPDLREFAATQLGLEVSSSMNAKTLRSKIATVAPDLKHVPSVSAGAAPEPEPAAIPVGYVPVEGEDPAKRPAAISMPAGADLLHQSMDPKVELEVLTTTDKARAKACTVSVNGVVTRIERGKKVSVPYRVFLAMQDAVEYQAVDTDENNPITGEPIKDWVPQHSYPFRVTKMPTDEEIADWHKRTDKGFMGSHRPAPQHAPVAA